MTTPRLSHKENEKCGSKNVKIVSNKKNKNQGSLNEEFC
jgi:hypothetical protein